MSEYSEFKFKQRNERKQLGLCVLCGKENDRLPIFTCSTCFARDRS